MEKPLFVYRNHLRNLLIVTIWAFLLFLTIKALAFTFAILGKHINWNPDFFQFDIISYKLNFFLNRVSNIPKEILQKTKKCLRS